MHAGPLGAGSTVKLAHNVMVYLGYLSALEAVELAHAAGVADGLVREITLASGTLFAQSEVWLDIYERRRIDPGDEAEQATFHTYAALLDKDMRAALRGRRGPWARPARHPPDGRAGRLDLHGRATFGRHRRRLASIHGCA